MKNKSATKIKKDKNFISCLNQETGFYFRTGILEDGKDTGVDPFMASFPELLDVGIMGHCIHGKTGLCQKAGIGCYQDGLHSNNPNMSLEDFKKIAEQCKGKTFQFALGGCGDPDQHEHFEEILKVCKENDIVPNFTTSGFGMTKALAKLCKQYCGAVAVSWYRSPYTIKAINLLLAEGVKTNIHCICCGKVGNTLVNVDRDSVNPKNSRFVCAECIESLSTALAQGETVGYQQNKKDVIDNYNINLHRIEEIEKENAEYEKQIQQLGLAKLGPEKTVTLEGRDSDVKVQVSYTVKEVTKAGFKTLKSYMNENVSDTYLSSNVVEKFDSNSDFKKAAVIIYTEDWEKGTFADTLAKYGYEGRIKPDVLAKMSSRWKHDDLESNKSLLAKTLGVDKLEGDNVDEMLRELTRVAKFNYVKQIFPKVNTCADIDLLKDCLIVSSCIKIKK